MKDLKFDEDFEFVDGDFQTITSNTQETEFIVKSNKGVWKQSPLVGVGILQELNGEFIAEEIKKINALYSQHKD